MRWLEKLTAKRIGVKAGQSMGLMVKPRVSRLREFDLSDNDEL